MELTKEEIRSIQLEMLKEFDSICLTNGLRYSLAYGTLLGAIRHKGFIPWDDDIDIMMPISDIHRLKEILHSKNIEYIDCETSKYYEWFFPRLCHKHTGRIAGVKFITYGVSIDLYPIIPIYDKYDDIVNFLRRGAKLANLSYEFVKWRGRFIRRIPISTIPFFNSAVQMVKKYIDLNIRVGSSQYFSVGGTFELKDCYNYDMFDNIIEVDFEGYRFSAIANFDDYLRQNYGEYMQLPPEDQRISYHGGVYIWQ